MTAALSFRPRPALIRAALLYAAVLLAGAALFFALHYAGNTISYDLALEKTLTELDSDQPDLGYLTGIASRFEYCHRAVRMLGGAKQFEGDHPVVDAVLLRFITFDHATDYCSNIRRFQGNDNLYQGVLLFRYWWGSTAIHAIALRFLSDADIREWIRTLTIFAWGLLALAAWFLSRKAFLAIVPVGIFAAFFSGLQYFSDPAHGFPFLLAPLAGAALALAMSRRAPAYAAPLCCFVIGMASSYLWLLDGHNILVVVLIGLAAYFGSAEDGARRRIATAIRWAASYIAGFALSMTVGQLIKAAFAEWSASAPGLSAGGVFVDLFQRTAVRNDQLSDTLSQAFANGWAGIPIIRDFAAYWIMGPDRSGFGQAVTLLSALVFAISLAFAAAQFYKGRKSLLADISWLAVLMAATSLQFIIPDDLPDRSSRYLFIWHALCWSSFLLAAKEAFGQWREAGGTAEPDARDRRQAGNRQSRRQAARQRPRDYAARRKVRLPKSASAGIFFAAAVLAAAVFAGSLLRSESAFARETVAETQPRISGPFNVYYNENKLVYAREECDAYDAAPRFSLHILPVNVDDLPDDRVEHGFDNLDFSFAAHKVPYGDGCAAVVNLPDYEIVAVATGQFISGERQIWNGEFRLPNGTR